MYPGRKQRFLCSEGGGRGFKPLSGECFSALHQLKEKRTFTCLFFSHLL
jgi:hypothetical protein